MIGFKYITFLRKQVLVCMDSIYGAIFEVYSELSSSNPQIILPIATNAIAIVLIIAN